MGWNLAAYGTITKEVRGLPDGNPHGYYGVLDHSAEILAVAADYEDDGVLNNTTLETVRKFRDKEWDAEVDKYSVSVNGMSFSFKLRKDSNGDVVPYYLSKHNHKVQVNMHPTDGHFVVGSFVVTDDQGVKYHFDSDNREHAVVEDTQNPADVQDRYTSWMLSKVEYLNGQSIDFQYRTETYFSWDFVATALSLHGDVDEGPIVGSGVVQYQTFDSDRMQRSEMLRQVLEKITFPEGEIAFTTGNAPSNHTIFTKIQVKNRDAVVVDTYDFTYQGNRDCLTEIQKNNEFLYGFEYFGLNTGGGLTIPAFYEAYDNKPYAQDLWRFYNGRIGNNSAFSLGSSNFIADRTPNANNTRLGALKTIKYKTGGTTEVAYELNQIKVPYDGSIGDQGIPSLNEELLVSLNPTPTNNEREVVETITFTEPTFAYVSHKIDGQLWNNFFQMSMTKLDGPCNVVQDYNECYDGQAPDYSWNYTLQAEYLRSHMRQGSGTNSCTYFPYPVMCLNYISSPTGPDDTETPMYFEEGNSGGYIYIAPGTYEIMITTNHMGNNFYRSGDLYGEIRIQYHDASVNGIPPTHINKNTGGIRVSRITDYDEHGNQVLLKEFDYNDATGFSSAVANQIPVHSDIHSWNYQNASIAPYHWIEYREEHKQAAYTSLNGVHGFPVYYRKVKVTHKNGNHINGIVEQNYDLPMQGGGYYSYPRVPKHGDLTKSMPTQSFQYKGGTLVSNNPTIVSSTTNNHDVVRYNLHHLTQQDLNPEHPVSFKIYKELDVTINYTANQSVCYCQLNPTPGSAEDMAWVALHGISVYRDIDAYRRVNETISSIDGVTSSTIYNYDIDTYLQSTSTTDSKGETLTTEFDYPFELAAEYQNLIDTQQLSVPVQQRSLRDGTLLSTQKTNFIQVVNGYKPHTVLTAKGTNTLENRIEFTYDDQGNIIQYYMNDNLSAPVAVIWGYDKQHPIAKIQNATYAQVQTHAITLLGLSNADNDSTYGYTGNEGALREALDALRNDTNLSNALITTYTYDPMVGITSVTDARGYTIYYEYDNQQRVIRVKDAEGNILSEYNYNYRPQN